MSPGNPESTDYVMRELSGSRAVRTCIQCDEHGHFAQVGDKRPASEGPNLKKCDNMWILQDLKKKTTLGIPQGKLHWRTNEGRQDKCSFKKKKPDVGWFHRCLLLLLFFAGSEKYGTMMMDHL
jgi:hypothetical protein